MIREAMLAILWIFYGRQNPLAYWCPRAVKLIHINNKIYPHQYPTKKTKFEKIKKNKNGKYEIKNALKVPKKPSFLDYKNIFIKASIASITRFFFLMRNNGVGIFFFRKPVLLVLYFAINEPLPRRYTVIFCAFLTRFGQKLPNKCSKNEVFLRIKKSQT